MAQMHANWLLGLPGLLSDPFRNSRCGSLGGADRSNAGSSPIAQGQQIHSDIFEDSLASSLDDDLLETLALGNASPTGKAWRATFS
jgi:hypothetical protein